MTQLSDVEQSVLSFIKQWKQDGKLGGVHPITASEALGIDLDLVNAAMVSLNGRQLVIYYRSNDPHSCMVTDVTPQGWNTE